MKAKAEIGKALRDSGEFAEASAVVAGLRAAGRQAWFVGGAVRDILLGLPPKDIDIATSATPDEVSELFPRSHLIGASFGVVTVVSESGRCFEVATLREEREYMDGRHPERLHYTQDPEIDVMRRDFTINGLLFDPKTETVIDYVGGMADLKAGVLRTIGDPERRFSEDHLRILRAIRFCVRFRLTMDKATEEAIPLFAPKLKLLSAERVRDEFNKMLCGPDPARAFEMALKLGALKELAPEIAALSGVEQPPEHHPEGDVFTHTMLMLKHMTVPSVELGWAILLHDIGKPGTFGRDPEDVIHFYGHEELGANMAAAFLERFKMPRDASNSIEGAVRNHMRFAHVHLMRPAKWRRLVASPDFPLELELHRIDCIASHAKLSNYLILLDRIREISEERALPAPLLTGKDLIALGMKPGPGMGKVLREISDLQLEGAIATKDEAIAQLKALGTLPA